MYENFVLESLLLLMAKLTGESNPNGHINKTWGVFFYLILFLFKNKNKNN